MARLNEDGQWIVMMGFIVSISILILAIVVGESSLVGKTTSESVLEFSKFDIQDFRSEIMTLKESGVMYNEPVLENVHEDLFNLSIKRKNAIVNFSFSYWETGDFDYIFLHFNNGITTYNEVYYEYTP